MAFPVGEYKVTWKCGTAMRQWKFLNVTLECGNVYPVHRSSKDPERFDVEGGSNHNAVRHKNSIVFEDVYAVKPEGPLEPGRHLTK